MTDERAVAVIGSGSIGVGFAVLFARAGFDVRVQDPDEAALTRAESDLADRLALLESADLLRESTAVVASLVSFHTDLAVAARSVSLVQECAPEHVSIKQEVLAAAAEAVPRAVLASSSSAIPPSRIAAGLADDAARRVIVGHPGNPPYLLPVIEVVPSPRTDPTIVESARAIYADAGMRPVTIRREVEGFVFNRLQGALLREAYCLVRDGVVDADDVDEIVRSGLGRRWSVIGPFETSDLNVRGGIAAHAARMGPAYERMGAERGQSDPWTAELVGTVAAQRRSILPLEEWEERVRWRDERLMTLATLWDAEPRKVTR
ncbi:3-hydroxyacyl-CoA dehydrogenase [Microbacterium trichothecenolyticum]|uniref:3-hydroxyacyl-CoA dehydrogenase n=1 Tax=Microbacterium trichothecenolyticum TaxID=69370 RepID=UPI002856EE21|nr:3-hydroxyacyl-CoA dehydrogenase [Microbacterium trichothecenolyticum]MDR7183262.1 3-hydroxyacyl-CoA dehydrogenase [Microbacterium trichothecenolyticum]